MHTYIYYIYICIYEYIHTYTYIKKYNISHINENTNDMNNTELGGSSSTTTSITTDEPSINGATLTDE